MSEDPAEPARTRDHDRCRYLGAGRAAEFGRRDDVPGEPAVRLRPLRAVADPDVTG